MVQWYILLIHIALMRELKNERHNRIFRKYVPKGKSIENYSAERILWFAEDMNSLPRKSLGYDTPDNLFEAYLDTVYAA